MTPKLSVRSIEWFERPVHFRMPFRFGSVSVEQAPQVFVHVTIEVEGVGSGAGAAAELMVPKWFNKDPQLSPDQTVAQLRRALTIASEHYLQRRPSDTAFGLHATCHDQVIAACGAEGIPPLAAGFGIAEIDKAILDALLRVARLDFFSGLNGNIAGLDARLTPDLDNAAIEKFLAIRTLLAPILVRHTIGMLDPLNALAAIHDDTGCRYFKLKLGGDVTTDRERLIAIAAALDDLRVDYRVTLDANEQYPDHATLTALVEPLRQDKALESIARRLLYIEQPLPREQTWNSPLGDLGKSFAFIIDEAESAYDAFPNALKLGYRGISSKACKGIYKSLLNGARAARWNESGGAQSFIAAEDLTCQPGLALQQDTALAAFHGIVHAERNGHHYVDGFAENPPAEARAFLQAHPDLYEEADGQVRLAIRDGGISTASLAQPGFASGVDPRLVGRPSGNHEMLRKRN